MTQEKGHPDYPVILYITQDGDDADAPTAWSLTKGYEVLSEGNSVSYASAEASAVASTLAMGNRTRIYTNSESIRTRLGFLGVDNVATLKEYNLLQSGVRTFCINNNVKMFGRYRGAKENKVPAKQTQKESPKVIAPKAPKGMVKYGSLPRLTIATDASMSFNVHTVAGIAWVAADGRHAAKTVDVGDGGIMVAELWAIHDIFTSMHKGQKLLVQSDSTSAVHAFNDRHNIIQKGDKHCSRKIEVLEAIEREMAYRDVEIVWIKGHSGHAMNETADKLAKFARRCHEKGNESLERWQEVDRILLEGIGFDRTKKDTDDLILECEVSSLPIC